MQLENDEIFVDDLGRHYNIVWDGDIYRSYEQSGITFGNPSHIASALRNTQEDHWVSEGKNIGPVLLKVTPPRQTRGTVPVPLPNPALDGGILHLTHERTLRNVTVNYSQLTKPRLRVKGALLFADRFAINVIY